MAAHLREQATIRFLARELGPYSALAKEARAATNSRLIGVVERTEIEEAVRRFGKRRERE